MRLTLDQAYAFMLRGQPGKADEYCDWIIKMNIDEFGEFARWVSAIDIFALFLIRAGKGSDA